MGRFITNNFLSPRVAVARLTSVDFVGLVARWLEDERKARAVAAATDAPFSIALDIVPKVAIDEWVALAARRGVEAVPAAPLASRGRSILGRRERARRCSIRASILSRRRSSDTRDHHSGIWRKNPDAGSQNGSTTCSPPR
jgi:uncharacterized membrane-anchored protein YjiN (DUF445 family)